MISASPRCDVGRHEILARTARRQDETRRHAGQGRRVEIRKHRPRGRRGHPPQDRSLSHSHPGCRRTVDGLADRRVHDLRGQFDCSARYRADGRRQRQNGGCEGGGGCGKGRLGRRSQPSGPQAADIGDEAAWDLQNQITSQNAEPSSSPASPSSSWWSVSMSSPRWRCWASCCS